MADHSDVLMMLCKSGNTGLKADGQHHLVHTDDLLNLDPKFSGSHCFEIESFTVNISATRSDSAEAKNTPQAVFNDPKRGMVTAPPKIGATTTWTHGLLNPVSVSRTMDQSSPELFKECGLASNWDHACIARRKVVGGGLKNVSAGGHMLTYVRFNFDDVVIIDVQWNSTDEGMKETFQFVAKHVKVHYRFQKHDGTLGPALVPGFWDQ